jgi:hypothetical protein
MKKNKKTKAAKKPALRYQDWGWLSTVEELANDIEESVNDLGRKLTSLQSAIKKANKGKRLSLKPLKLSNWESDIMGEIFDLQDAILVIESPISRENGK